MLKVLIFLTFFLVNLLQVDEPVEMADSFRGEGKIYVLIAIFLIILAGLFIYLFRIDKKISRLEKEREDSQT